MPFSPNRLNHAVLYVTDLPTSLDFYTRVFGMEIVQREPRMNAAFLRLPKGSNHHDLGLFGVGPTNNPRPGRRTGLYHLAWQVATIDDLAEARTTLLDNNAYNGESSHGATLSIYGQDPDGNEFEVMWMLPREAWGDYAHNSVVEPLNLDAQLERWSGISTI